MMRAERIQGDLRVHLNCNMTILSMTNLLGIEDRIYFEEGQSITEQNDVVQTFGLDKRYQSCFVDLTYYFIKGLTAFPNWSGAVT